MILRSTQMFSVRVTSRSLTWFFSEEILDFLFWIQLSFREVQNAFIAKWLRTALSQMSILTVGSSPGRSWGMRLNLPLAIIPLRRTDNEYWNFQPPAAQLGDEQMLRFLGRGHSVPTVTVLIFVWAQWLTILLLKHFALCGTINWIPTVNCSAKCKML